MTSRSGVSALPSVHTIDADDEFLCLWCQGGAPTHAVYTYHAEKARYYFFCATHESCAKTSPNADYFKHIVPMRVAP